MDDARLDMMIEQASANEWEKQQAKNADWDSCVRAAKSLGFAMDDLNSACDLISEGAEILVDTVEGDKVSSLLEDAESVLRGIKNLKKAFEGKGVKK